MKRRNPPKSSRSPAPDALTPVQAQWRTDDGSWQPLALAALPQQILSGRFPPDRRVRYCALASPRAEDWIELEARNFPQVPRRELGEQVCTLFADVVSGREGSGTLGDVMAAVRSAAAWAPSEMAPLPATGRQAEAPMGDAPAKSDIPNCFSYLLLFIEAVCVQMIGPALASEPLYKRITCELPEAVGEEVWFCARHQLACLGILRGDETGINSLCDLVVDGKNNPTMRSAATDYTFAELMRLFVEADQEYLPISETLAKFSADWKLSSPWRGNYADAIATFRSRARDQELPPIESMQVMWPQRLSKWEQDYQRGAYDAATAVRRCGALLALSVQDIPAEFRFVDCKVRQRHRMLRQKLDHSIRLFEQGRSLEAESLAQQVMNEAKDDAAMVRIADSAAKLHDRIVERNQLQEWNARKTTLEWLLERLNNLPADPAEARATLDHLQAMAEQAGVEEWQLHLKAAEASLESRRLAQREALHRRVREEVEDLCSTGEGGLNQARIAIARQVEDRQERQRLLAEVDAREASARLEDALKQLAGNPDAALASLRAAAALNPKLEETAGAFEGACLILEAGLRSGLASLAGIAQLQQVMKDRFEAALKRSSAHCPSGADVEGEIRSALGAHLVSLLTSMQPDGDALRNFAAELLAQFIGSGACDAALDMYDLACQRLLAHSPSQRLIPSPGYELRQRITTRRFVQEGRRLLASTDSSGAAGDDAPKAAAAFRQAIGLDHLCLDAWEGLIHIRVQALPVPFPKKQQLSKTIADLVKSQGDKMAARASTPDTWIDQQIPPEWRPGQTSGESKQDRPASNA